MLKIHLLEFDKEGKFVLVKGDIHDRKFTLRKIYAPDSQQKTF